MIEVRNPADLEDVVAIARPAAADEFVEACRTARAAQEAWARTPAPRRLTYPLGWGTLGCAFPQSLGAALSGGGPVVSVSGDGGFLFACGELATVAQEALPLTTVIVDDGGYGMLRYDQRRSGAATYGVDLRTPDFVTLAESFGVRADAVDGLDDAFSAALSRHVADPEPSVLVARAALEPPPTTSPRWYRPAG